MYRKFSAVAIVVVVLLFFVVESRAQNILSICNNTGIEVYIGMSGPACTGPFPVPPGQCIHVASPPCGFPIIINGTSYPVGYNGPVVNPPNPPNWVVVTATGATFW